MRFLLGVEAERREVWAKVRVVCGDAVAMRTSRRGERISGREMVILAGD